MSRLFSSVADYLNLNSTYPIKPPYSVSAWVKRTTISVLGNAVSLGVGTNNDRSGISADAADVVDAVSRDASVSTTAQSTGTILLNTWQLYTGVFVSTNSRAAFLNGTNKGNSVVTRIPLDSTGIWVGIRPDLISSITGYMAHVALWDIDLSDAEVANLVTMDPRLVQPSHLMHYWPLRSNTSPEPNYGNRGETIPVTGTTFSTDDPPTLIGVQEAGTILRIEKGAAG